MLIRIRPRHEYRPDGTEYRNFSITVYTPSPRRFFVNRLIINETEININELFDARGVSKIWDIYVEAENVVILQDSIEDKPAIVAKITTRQPLSLNLP